MTGKAPGRDTVEFGRWAAVLVLAMVMAVGLSLHVPYLNGPSYWAWPWRRIDTLRIVPAMLVAALPFFFAVWLYERGRIERSLALSLLALSTFLLELVAIGIQGPGFDLRRIAFVVEHPIITSYYTDAAALGPVLEALAHYPERMAEFHLHSINKPPGPILYYAFWLHLVGPQHAAMVGGLGIGFMAALTVPATFGLASRLGAGREAAFHAAAYAALCPGLILFFPEFDQAFPLWTCALVATWSLSLERKSVWWPVLFGVVLAATAFVSFGLLVLGAFLAGQTVVFLMRRSSGGFSRVGVAAGIAIGVATALYLLLAAWTGFSLVATFEAAWTNQAQHAATLGRPWPATVVFDLLDFALGTGWIAFALVGFWLVRRWGAEPMLETDWTCWLVVGQLLLMAGAALIPVETARVWLFMVPLLMVPVGLELARWLPAARLSVYVALWGLLVFVGQNLVFLGA